MRHIFKSKLETFKGAINAIKLYLKYKKKNDDQVQYEQSVKQNNIEDKEKTEFNKFLSNISDKSPQIKINRFYKSLMQQEGGMEALMCLNYEVQDNIIKEARLNQQNKINENFRFNSSAIIPLGKISENDLIRLNHNASFNLNESLNETWNDNSRNNNNVSLGAGFGGLFNSYVGQGSSLDFSSYDFRASPQFIMDQSFTVFFQTSPIAKQLIDILTRWYGCKFVNTTINKKTKKDKTLTESEESKINKVQELIKEKHIMQFFITSVKKMFMHGGCALYIITDDQDESLPLVMEKGKYFRFQSIDKSLMFPASFINLLDASKEGFNHPSHWRVIFSGTRSAQPIHKSRFIFFIPDELPFEARIQQLWWGMSCIVPVKDYINMVDRGYHSIGNQLQQSSIAIFKNAYEDKANRTKGLLKNAALQSAANVEQAFTQNGNFIAIGEKSNVGRMEVGNLTEQASAAEKLINIVTCAFGIPPAEFFSSSSGGYHSSDPTLLSWLNTVGMARSNYTGKSLDQLYDLISIYLFGKKDIVYYEFPELNEPSILQKADIRLKNAQTAAISKKIGFPNELIAKQAVRNGDFEDLSMDNVDEIIKQMDSFDEGQKLNLGMEGKGIKDDKSSTKSLSDSLNSPSPESIVSDALK